MSALLSVDGVSAAYGHVQALRGVSVSIDEGEIVTLIGANGAGKSSLLMALFGQPAVSSGHLLFDGRDITGWPAHEVARLGLAQVPEGRRVFARMTVMENLVMGAELAQLRGVSKDRLVGKAGSESGASSDLDEVFDLFPRLAERQWQRAGTLSGGEQQMLAIARALMSRPRLLLLDEPSLGLAPLIVGQIMAALARINRERGLSIFLVEQDAFHALKLASRGYVMASGEIVLEDAADALLRNPEVRAAYLGL